MSSMDFLAPCPNCGHIAKFGRWGPIVPGCIFGRTRAGDRQPRHPKGPEGGAGVPRGTWRTVEHVEIATLEWAGWFNHQRLCEDCGDVPPAELEAC
jgi:hypothetical protein